MMKNKDICEDFVNGSSEGSVGHLYIERNVLFSYGSHFPLAIRLINVDGQFKFILNSDKYSRTTSRHKTELIRFINQEDIIQEFETGEMQKLADSKISSVKELMLESLEK